MGGFQKFVFITIKFPVNQLIRIHFAKMCSTVYSFIIFVKV